MDFMDAVGGIADPKEWTEIVGMYWRAKEVMETFKPDIIYDIGCGKRPTLGAFIALNVKSVDTICCLDPQLDDSLGKGIEGLNLLPITLEDYTSRHRAAISSYDEKPPIGKALILCNHAHVKKEAIKVFRGLFEDWVYITSPCCVDNRFPKGEYYKDKNVWSPKNEYFTFKKAHPVRKKGGGS